ncbi:MATE family efflux transporter [Pseudoteredinibacter isoporae]|uniref:Multidrug-efflux transporter n=1 Tax=Pseudoteredinibacter isoporae TaxID=570281 RepID=A0A7X0JUL6_9GAMM|nr:MATE family efflux transporter [Pseudoteredinibacter isoporae]MBB6521616.1 MATE family multidrug resistance protein [Pseudoteredinibacter isoporae]NHO87170.1 MATE family efflux transporter [Pseudoteredinibacter isoporae]NIB22994.1 MATE family efflux transporter [Pseudoteredinibacter isoporae]
MNTQPQATSRFDQLPELVRLAWPILISQLAISGMGVVDTIMAGSVSSIDLAAVAVAFSLWLPILMFSVGLFSATSSLVAHAWGARDPGTARLHTIQSIWIAIALGIGAAALVTQAPFLLKAMDIDPSVHPIVIAYLDAMVIGLPAAAVYQVLRASSEGTGHSKPVMQINLLAFFANIPLNFIFVHGYFGLPAMGGAGCGWATATVMWLNTLALALYMHKAPQFRELKLFRGGFMPPQLNAAWQILALGLPIGAAVFAEVVIFSIIALLIGSLGATVIAGHQISMNVSAITFMLPLSVSIAITVQVGQRLGAKRPMEAQRTWRQAMLLATAIATTNAILIYLFAWPITGIYSDELAIRELATGLLLFAAAYQISDALQVAAAGALRGYKDTQVTMYITLFAYWGVGLPLGYTLGLTDLITAASGPKGFWISLLISLSLAAVLLMWRLQHISRRNMAISTTING